MNVCMNIVRDVAAKETFSSSQPSRALLNNVCKTCSASLVLSIQSRKTRAQIITFRGDADSQAAGAGAAGTQRHA